MALPSPSFCEVKCLLKTEARRMKAHANSDSRTSCCLSELAPISLLLKGLVCTARLLCSESLLTWILALQKHRKRVVAISEPGFCWLALQEELASIWALRSGQRETIWGHQSMWHGMTESLCSGAVSVAQRACYASSSLLCPLACSLQANRADRRLKSGFFCGEIYPSNRKPGAL